MTSSEDSTAVCVGCTCTGRSEHRPEGRRGKHARVVCLHQRAGGDVPCAVGRLVVAFVLFVCRCACWCWAAVMKPGVMTLVQEGVAMNVSDDGMQALLVVQAF